MNIEAAAVKSPVLCTAERAELALKAVADRRGYLNRPDAQSAMVPTGPAGRGAASTVEGGIGRCYNATSLVRLSSWPDLREVPDSKLMMTARMCALLSRRPGAAGLVALRLGVEDQEARTVMEEMWHKGLLHCTDAAHEVHEQTATSDPEVATDQEVRASIWRKLFQRLTR